jgi:hypothetical protein
MQRINVVTVFAALAMAVPAMAQGRGRGNAGIPPGQRPAAGMCRIWIEGVPPGLQPAPTDCRTATARVPRNGQVIYGDQTDQRNRRIYQSNGQVVTINGQRCVQRADRNGTVRNICADGDNDRDDHIVARADRRDDGRFDRNTANGKKLKHKQHKHDKDHDRDRDHDREHHNEFDRHIRH